MQAAKYKRYTSRDLFAADSLARATSGVNNGKYWHNFLKWSDSHTKSFPGRNQCTQSRCCFQHWCHCPTCYSQIWLHQQSPRSCSCLLKKKRYEQLNGDTSEIRLTALHVLIGGAGQRFHVVGLRGSDGERSQCDGDEDGELGEHHLDCKKLE